MKKTVAKYLCIILSVAMLVTALPLTVYAEDSVTVKAVGSAADLKTVCDEINTNGGKYTINLTADIIDGQVDITKSGAVVTVNGNGKTITNNRTAVFVSDGAKVILGDGKSDLILKGTDTFINGVTNDCPGLIDVLPDSTCEMNKNVTVKDRKGQNYLGAGATVEGGTFVMNGGIIDNCGIDGGSVCYGGGVAVYNGGHFTMNGGTISNCYAITEFVEENSLYKNSYSGIGGGVFVTDASVFTMNGGTISNNTATNFGGGVAMTLSDIETKTDPDTGEEIIDPNTGKGYVDLGNPRSKVTINSGTLSGNNAKNGAGIFVSGLIYAFADIFRRVPFDAGNIENPGLYINGGENKTVEISSNKADEMGGGVMIIGLRDTRKAQIHNTKIINNTATKGAGVMNYSYWTQLDIDGCTISGNKATSNGGGVCAINNKDNGAKTIIKNTTISGNISGDRGAGIYYDGDSELHISGKDIVQNNTYNGVLNNLNVFDKDKPVYVDGDLTGSQIGLSDPMLWDDGKEDIAADAVSCDYLTNGYKANNDTLIPYNAFTSDHESWYVDYGTTKEITVPTGESYYKYTAQKYTVQSITDSGISCAGEKISVKANTFSSGIATNPTVFKNEVLSRFQTSKYDNYGDDIDQNGYHWYYFLNSGNDTMVYVVFLNEYNVQILPNGKAVLKTSTGHQAQYANSGEFVYEYASKATRDNVVYSSDYTTFDVKYNEAISEDKNVYDYDELGHIISKTVISKASEELVGIETTEILDYTNEVRLVRKDINYHINNDEIDDNYNNNDIFTSYVEAATKEIKVGDTIEEFYTIPEVKATKTNSCPYIFKGWYYDPENDIDTHPVTFGTDKYSKDIYAHWIKVEDVAKDEEDDNELPPGYNGIYGGFDLAGVQVREGIRDTNYGYEKKPGGLRFVTSLNMDVVNQINAIKPNNIEYGYVAATNKVWIDYHSEDADRKLQYVSETANGIDTSSDKAADENYFGFASNIICTSRKTNGSGKVKEDHRNFDDYLLYTLVITYENVDDDAKSKNVLARPYIRYSDANGLERVAYSEYKGSSNTLGGCYTSYNAIAGNN